MSVMLRMTDARLAIGPGSQVASLHSARCLLVPNATPDAATPEAGPLDALI